MWKAVPSVAVFVFVRRPGPRFLVLERAPTRGHMFVPIMGHLEEGETPVDGAIRLLEDAGLSTEGRRPIDIGHGLTYYARETKFHQETFIFEVEHMVDPDLGDDMASFRWGSFDEALRLLTLTSHKKALSKALSEKVMPDGPVALGPVPMFDHVPVSHRSKTVFLCDFDGTVTVGEASIAILKAFAPESWERYERAWLDKVLTTHECLGLQFTIITSDIEELERFAAENVGLREGFGDFVGWCREMGHGLVITSSGIDFYIKAILVRHGLGDVPYLANRGIWVRDQGLVIEEGMVNEECDECGNCKTRLVEQYQAMGARVVFVGDGITDECAARRADMVFARRSLLEFCRLEGIDAVPFESFDDVRERFDG